AARLRTGHGGAAQRHRHSPRSGAGGDAAGGPVELVAWRAKNAMTIKRRLIVNADDFGLSDGVNRAISEAHAAGTVSSASLLVNAPGFADAVRRARAAPALGVGLHFNLTMGAPVSPATAVPSLCDRRTGRFWSLWRRATGGAPLPRHADHFRGFALTGRRDFLERLLAVLDHLEPGVTELMVHPGYPDASLEGWVRYRAGRERELAALLSGPVRDRLRRGGIEMMNFAEI